MAERFFEEIAAAFPDRAPTDTFAVTGEGAWPSWFDVTGLATATIGSAGLMLAHYADPVRPPAVSVDRRRASLWFDMTLRPDGWDVPSPWDPLAGDYRAADGWIRLHTNAPHHRAAALSVLGGDGERAAVERAVAAWRADALETAVVEAGGCAAAMRSREAWSVHPQGGAVAREPLIDWLEHAPVPQAKRPLPRDRPLAGIRVLDLTRVLAGPVGGRFLAAFGASVLRIDPPDWDEPGVVPEVTLGKRCAGLDLNRPQHRAVFERRLAEADVLLHGYRPGALAGLGFGPATLRRLNPHVIDVCLDAYGWTGPWAGRRGFDSLVQMSAGLAAYGMRMSGADRPVPLPVQALDHATGYLMAAAALWALGECRASGRVFSARLSLARTAHLLSGSDSADKTGALSPEGAHDIDPRIEHTDWGPARRIRFPLTIVGIDHRWDLPAGRLHVSHAKWPDAV